MSLFIDNTWNRRVLRTPFPLSILLLFVLPLPLPHLLSGVYTSGVTFIMCLWKNNYYTKCGHQPIYIQSICLNRTVTRDVFTNQRIVRACNSINIPTVQTINDVCPDCVSMEIPRLDLDPYNGYYYTEADGV